MDTQQVRNIIPQTFKKKRLPKHPSSFVCAFFVLLDALRLSLSAVAGVLPLYCPRRERYRLDPWSGVELCSAF